MKDWKKMRNKKGFTLAELLIVVAIIAVLVAVSVPIFSSKLEKAREATDVANMRAAKAAAVSLCLEGDIETETAVWYDANAGKLVTSNGLKGYGQGTGSNGGVVYEGYTSSETYKNKVIKVTITPEGKDGVGKEREPEVKIEWVAEGATS